MIWHLHPRRRTRAWSALIVVGATVTGLGIGLSGCGVPIDDEPQAVTQTTLPRTDATPTTAAGTGAAEVSAYFLRGERLVSRRFPVEGDPTLTKALEFALAPPTGEGATDLSTSVPPGTVLRGVNVADGIATIDLSSEIDDVSGPAQKEAFAQLVFTALAFPGVDEVRFLVDGAVIDAPTDDGNLEGISAENYDRPLNPR